MSPHRPLLLLLLLLLHPPPPTTALPLLQLRTLLSLSQSLLTRVATARTSRGDTAGAARARSLAAHLRSLPLSGPSIWPIARDFAWNYAWSGLGGLHLPTSDTVQLISALSEAYQLDSAAERADWAVRNQRRLRNITGSLFKSLLKSFSRPGPLREVVLVLQKEVYEGELLRDCLEVGAGDLEGLIRIARDMFSSASSSHAEL